MPTIVYYPEPIEVEISMEEYMRRESAPMRIREETGRMARRAIAEYEEIMAEFSAEKSARAEKFRKTHDICKKSKNDTPADRKQNRKSRMIRQFGEYEEDDSVEMPCGSRKNMYFHRHGKDGRKKAIDMGADIIRNMRISSAEKYDRADWDLEMDAIIDDLDWAYLDMEYLNEKIEMLRHNLHVGDNYVRFNRLCERRNVVAEFIRKNRFVEEMLNDEFGFQNMEREDYDND